MARKSYSSPPPPKFSPPPPPAANPILKVPTVKMEQPSLGRTLMEGFAFGTGSSIARESVSRIFNSNSTTTTPDIELQKNDKQHNCEKMLFQMNECFQTDNMCGDLLEKYLLQCSNQSSYLHNSSSNV